MPEATGTMNPDTRQALNERRDLIQTRAETCLDTALTNSDEWVGTLGTPPPGPRESATWRQYVTVIAAYRDRYSITTSSALGTAESTRQKIDEARAQAALTQAQRITNPTQKASLRRTGTGTGTESVGRTL